MKALVELNAALCKALGIEGDLHDVASVDLRIRPNAFPQVTITTHLLSSADETAELFKECVFDLTPRDDPPDETAERVSAPPFPESP